MSVRDFQERKKVERILFSWPILMILVGLLVIALWGLYNIWQSKRALDQEIARLEQETAKAEATRKNYETTFEALETVEGVDREARARFNLKKPGEEVVIFVDDMPKASKPSSRAANIFSAITNWFENLFR